MQQFTPLQAVRPKPAGHPIDLQSVQVPTGFQTAILVNSREAERVWLDRHLQRGWSVTRQELIDHNGRFYDVITVRHANAQVGKYYFDVTCVLGRPNGRHPGGECALVEPTINPGGEVSIDIGQGGVNIRGNIDTPTGSSVSCPINPNGVPGCGLPSGDSACKLMSGDWSVLPTVAVHTLLRAGLIAAGIAAAGERDPKKLAKYGIGAALAIESFALVWASMHQQHAPPR